jgi:hypothetical protein
MWHGPPGDTPFDQTGDAMEDLAKVDISRPPAGLDLERQGLDQFPLLIGQAGRVRFAPQD